MVHPLIPSASLGIVTEQEGSVDTANKKLIESLSDNDLLQLGKWMSTVQQPSHVSLDGAAKPTFILPKALLTSSEQIDSEQHKKPNEKQTIEPDDLLQCSGLTIVCSRRSSNASSLSSIGDELEGVEDLLFTIDLAATKQAAPDHPETIFEHSAAMINEEVSWIDLEDELQ